MKNTDSCHWLERENAVFASGVRIPFYPLSIKEAQGDIIRDHDGNEWIDFLSSACTANTGHGHPHIIETMKAQLDQLVHYNPAYASHATLVTLAEELIRITPGSFPKRVTFGLSGGDANDTALKLVRSYTKRPYVLAFSRSYHGNTYGALSLSAVSLPMRKHMGPLLPGIYHVPYPDPYRSGLSPEEESKRCISEIEHIFSTVAPPEEVAAIFIEPIQGDSGIIVPPQSFINQLQTICDKHGILIVADEVQSGFGRTGKWFASEHFNLEPDLIILGKSIASGMPLSAVVGQSDILTSWEPPAGAFSLAANPVSCAAALATIEVIEKEGLVDRARHLGAVARERFEQMQAHFPMIGDIRGKGLLLGVDLVENRETKQRSGTQAAKLCWRCWEKGVFITFFSGSVLRVAPPLTISEAHFEEALNIIEESFEDVEQGLVPDTVLESIKGW